MDVALIAPRSMLPLTQLGDIHFIIPPTADEKFYSNESKFKILDNGVYETGRSLTIDELLDLARKVQADEIIIPDVMFDFLKTCANIEMYFNNYKKMKYGVMIVPQAKCPDEWIDAYVTLTMKYPEADCIGIPKWLDGKFHCRSAILHCLQRHNLMVNKPHHLLGVDNLADLITTPFKGIRSCDTSKPFTYAYANKILQFWETEQIKRVDFNAPALENTTLLLTNITVLKEAAHWNDSDEFDF